MKALTSARGVALALGAAGMLLSGCLVGPSYRAPPPPAPLSNGFSATLTPYGGTAEQPPANWWQLYNDPAIDSLVQEALTHNKNLLVAAANLAEARAALSLARAGRFPRQPFPRAHPTG